MLDNLPLCKDCYETLSNQRMNTINPDFIAIDFEIANNKMNSACSLGMTFIKNNQIVNEKYYLIQPPTLHFDPETIKIHGLTSDDVRDAKKFNEIWEEIKPYFIGSTIIAHNAHFDMSVLHSCLTYYSLELPEFEYIDSIEVSSFAVPGYVRRSLKERTAYFNIEIENHHNALSDARACALIVTASLKLMKMNSLEDFCKIYKRVSKNQFLNIKPQTHFRMNAKYNNIKISDITPTVEMINVNHPLFMKNIVFTGDLRTFEREEAIQKAVNAGGIVKSGVSSKTDFLVVGLQDKSLVGKRGISTKEKKANELIEKGKEIKIINEREFLSLLKFQSTSLC